MIMYYIYCLILLIYSFCTEVATAGTTEPTIFLNIGCLVRPGRAGEAQGTWRGCGCHGPVFGHEIRHGPTANGDEEGEVDGRDGRWRMPGVVSGGNMKDDVCFNIWLEKQ